MTINLKNKLPHYLTVISAICLALSSPLYSFGFLVWVAFIPLIIVLDQASSWKQVLKESFYHQLIFSIGIFFWVPSAFKELWQESSMWVNTGFFLFLIAIVELQFVFWALTRFFIKQKIKNCAVLFILSAAIYTFFDYYTLKFFKDTLTHALYDHYTVKQLVSYIGIYGLTFLIVLINEVLASRRKGFSLIAIILLLSSYTVGYKILQKNQEKTISKTIQVVVIQPNISNKDIVNAKNKNPNGYKEEISQTLIQDIKNAVNKYPRAQVVILPESVYPIYFYSPENFSQESINLQLKQLVQDHNIHLFFGGSKIQEGLNSNVNIHLFNKDGKVQDKFYTKTKLFPFGEKIPFTDIFPFFNDWFPVSSVSYEGTELVTDYIGDTKVGTAICYETITQEVSAMYGQKGIKLLLNPTNESYFASIGEPQLALALTSFRALENKVPVVRSAATGISAYIDRHGIIRHQSKMNEKVILLYEVEIE